MPGKPIIFQPAMSRLPPWIGEKAFRNILQQRVEEALRIDAVESDLAGLDLFQHVVLLIGGKIGKALAAMTGLAMLVERRQPLAIELGRRQLRLRALLFAALDERTGLVQPLGRTVRSFQLPVDEHGAAGVLSSWRLRIRRNDAVGNGFHRARLVRREELPRSRPSDLGSR